MVQVDVVYPSNQALDDALTKFETRYVRGKTSLSDVLNHTDRFVNSVEGISDLLVLTHSQNALDDEDVWCIDPRGVLTMSVGKETYESLGLVGKALKFKGHMDRHVIRIPLETNTGSSNVHKKQKARLETWEKERMNAQDGRVWEVVYCSRDPSKDTSDLLPLRSAHTIRAPCIKKELRNVHIPIPTCTPRPAANIKQGKLKVTNAAFEPEVSPEDWDEDTMALFEWVGMVSLGAQRVQAHDQVNPFVAVYEPPSPSRVGDVTHLTWRGLLSPNFVESIVDIASSTIQTIPDRETFLSITCHAVPTSPVGHLPQKSESGGSDTENVPMRLPRQDGEDTLSVVIGRNESDGALGWLSVESLGQCDTRWG